MEMAGLIEENWDLVEIGEDTSEKLRVLVLDDDYVDRQKLRRLADDLDFPIEIAEADTLETFKAMLDSDHFDIVVIDFRLAAGDGLDALNVVGAHSENHAAAKIMVAGDAQLNTAVTAMKLGCDDYLSKDSLDADLFRASVMEALSRSVGKIQNNESGDLERVTEFVIGKISDESFAKMRPIVSRMLRQIRFLRQNVAECAVDYRSTLNDLEVSCLNLGEFINDMTRPQNYQGMGPHRLS